MIREGHEAGLGLVNPFALDDDIKSEVAAEIGFGGTPVNRVRRIIRYLNDKGYINFKYQANMSLTAVDAYHAKKGDCLSYTNLFLGIARYLKVPVYFIHVSEARAYYEQDGMFFVSSHMAVGYGGGIAGQTQSPYTVVVDFTREVSDWRLWIYEAVDDTSAFALFYNNVAVDHMVTGDVAYANKLLTFLLQRTPRVKELYNNLAVLRMREGRYDQALALLQKGLALFPNFQSFYTNAILAARGAGELDLAKEYQSAGRKVAHHDPFFLFNQGVNEYNQGDYDAAIQEFGEALKRQPHNPFIYAWLARVYLAAGDSANGVRAYEKALKLAPNHKMLETLRDEYPVLVTTNPSSGAATDPGTAGGETRVGSGEDRDP